VTSATSESVVTPNTRLVYTGEELTVSTKETSTVAAVTLYWYVPVRVSGVTTLSPVYVAPDSPVPVRVSNSDTKLIAIAVVSELRDISALSSHARKMCMESVVTTLSSTRSAGSALPFTVFSVYVATTSMPPLPPPDPPVPLPEPPVRPNMPVGGVVFVVVLVHAVAIAAIAATPTAIWARMRRACDVNAIVVSREQFVANDAV